jgi:hypothetical protein
LPIRHGKKGTAIRTASLSLIVLILFSCVPRKTFKIPSEEVTPSLLVQEISFDDIATITGSAGIRIFDNEEYEAYLTGVMNYRKPNSLSVSVFGPFGVTVMKMLLADGFLEIYVPKKDTLYMTQLNVPFILPDSKMLARYEKVIRETDDDFILDLYDYENEKRVLRSRYYFDNETLINRRIDKYNSNSLVFSLVIDERTQDNIPSEFSVIAGKSRFEVTAKDLLANIDIPEKAFSHMKAPHVRPIQDFLRTLAPNQ